MMCQTSYKYLNFLYRMFAVVSQNTGHSVTPIPSIPADMGYLQQPDGSFVEAAGSLEFAQSVADSLNEPELSQPAPKAPKTSLSSAPSHDQGETILELKSRISLLEKENIRLRKLLDECQQDGNYKALLQLHINYKTKKYNLSKKLPHNDPDRRDAASQKVRKSD